MSRRTRNFFEIWREREHDGVGERSRRQYERETRWTSMRGSLQWMFSRWIFYKRVGEPRGVRRVRVGGLLLLSTAAPWREKPPPCPSPPPPPPPFHRWRESERGTREEEGGRQEARVLRRVEEGGWALGGRGNGPRGWILALAPSLVHTRSDSHLASLGFRRSPPRSRPFRIR